MWRQTSTTSSRSGMPAGCVRTWPHHTVTAPLHLHHTALLAALSLKAHARAVQVGFIANLRSELSHTVVEKALLALSCMEHRGACSADEVSGDGAGIMTAVPWELLKAECPDLELHEKTTGCATSMDMRTSISYGHQLRRHGLHSDATEHQAGHGGTCSGC